MAITTDFDALPCTAGSGGHGCRFSGHKRTSPAGGNRHNVSVIVAECSCGKLRAKHTQKITYWDKRWIARVNHRIDCQNDLAVTRGANEPPSPAKEGSYPALAKKVDDAVKANQKAYQKAEVTADLFESGKVKAGKENA